MRSPASSIMRFKLKTFLSLAVISVFLSACNPLQGFSSDASHIDATFHPGVSSLGLHSQSDLNGSLSGFGGGTSVGIAPYGALIGASGFSGIKLGDSGNCDGSLTNCAELDPSWVNHYGDLIGYWKLNGTVGAVADGSVVPATVGANGSAFNTGGFLTQTSGHLREAVSFNPSDLATSQTESIDIPNGSIDLSSVYTPSWTMMAWVYPTSFNNIGDYPVIFSYGVYNSIGYSSGASGSTGQLEAWINNTQVYHSNDALILNAWNHVAIIYTSSALTFYINGVESGSQPNPPAVNVDSSGSSIGQVITHDTGGIAAKLDEVAVFKVALSAPDLKSIYDRQVSLHAGSFTSRVMDLLDVHPWNLFSWVPSLPFLKGLPDFVSGAVPSESITDYPALASSSLMQDIEAVWHLDEIALGSGGTDKDFKNSAGMNHWGKKVGGVSFAQPGKIGNAPQFNATGFISGDSLTIHSSMTLSVWIKTTTAATSVIFSNRNGVGNDNYYISGGQVQWMTGAVTSSVFVNDGLWHNLVWTCDGTYFNFYLDGTWVQTDPYAHVDGTDVFTIGGESGAAFAFEGQIDEVALWNRPLGDGTVGTPNEVQQLYARGASRLKFQVRACAQIDCSDGEFKGPDGTANTYFTELNNVSVQGLIPSGLKQASLPSMLLQNYGSPLPASQYFQYRSIFESDLSTPALLPELKSVKIERQF